MRSPSIDAMALRAASPAASPLKSPSRLPTDQPLPLLDWVSIMAVANDITSVFCSVCTLGIWVDAMAIRSWSMTTSPPNIRPSSDILSAEPARPIRSSDDWNASKARSIMRQPASTSPLPPMRINAGS